MKIQKDTQIMLDSLTTAVAEALEKKRRLEQYAVVWRDNQPFIVDNNDAKAESLKGVHDKAALPTD